MAITKNIFSGLLDRIKFNRIVTKNSTLSEMPYGESQVQAVDIDWNDAQVHELDENGLPKLDANGNAYFKTITTTGNLLEYIQKGTVTGMNHILFRLGNAENEVGRLSNSVIELINNGIDTDTITETIADYLENNPQEITDIYTKSEVEGLIQNLQAAFGSENTSINNTIAELRSAIDGLTGTDGEINDIWTAVNAKASSDYVATQMEEALKAISDAGEELTEAQQGLVIEAINSLLNSYDLNQDGTISSDEDGGAGLQKLLEQLLTKINKNTSDISAADAAITAAQNAIAGKQSATQVAEAIQTAINALSIPDGSTLSSGQQSAVNQLISDLLASYDLNGDGTISSSEDGGAGLDKLLQKLIALLKGYTDSESNKLNKTITDKVGGCVQISDTNWVRLRDGKWLTDEDLKPYTLTKDLPTLPPSMPDGWGSYFINSSTFKDAVSDNAPKAPSTPKIHLTFNIPESSTSLPFKTQFCTSGTTVTLKQNKIVAFDSSTTVGNTLNTVYFPLTNIISSLPELNCTLIGTKYSRSYSQLIEIPGTFKIYDENNEEITLVSSTKSGNKTNINNITQYLNKSNTTYTIIFTPTDETNYTEAVVSIFVAAMTDYTSDSVKTNIANLVSAYKEVDDIQSNNNSSNGSSSTTPKPSKTLEYAFKFDEDNVIINTRNNSIKLRHFFDSNTAGVYHFVDNNQTEDDLTDDREFFTVTIRETAPDPAYDPSKTSTPAPTPNTSNM